MLVNEFPPLPVGGAEIQAERLSTYLARNGWNVWVLTRYANGLPRKEQRNGFQILRPFTAGFQKIRTITFILSSIVILFQMRKQYQILHAHLAFGPAFIAAVMGRLLGKRVIVKLGGSNAIGDIQVSLQTWRGRLRLWVIRRWADVVIALTEVMHNEAVQAGFHSERMKIMNNGISSDEYIYSQSEKEETRRSLGLSEKTVVLFVGRLDPIKSLSTMVDAIDLARHENRSLFFIIVGEGPDRSALEDRVRERNLARYINFVGSQSNIRPYLQSSDIFVLPSKTEGISNALLEAMAAGLVCVATPVGGNNEVLGHGQYGVMVPVGDVQSWARTLIQLGRDENLRRNLGNRARERILKTYDFNVVGSQCENLYTELLSQKFRSVL